MQCSGFFRKTRSATIPRFGFFQDSRITINRGFQRGRCRIFLKGLTKEFLYGIREHLYLQLYKTGLKILIPIRSFFGNGIFVQSCNWFEIRCVKRSFYVGNYWSHCHRVKAKWYTSKLTTLLSQELVPTSKNVTNIELHELAFTRYY